MVNQAFQTFKSNLELTQSLQDEIKQKHMAIRTPMEKKGWDTKLIGSLGKQTKIHPKKDQSLDIDMLVVVGSFANFMPGGILPSSAELMVEEALLESKRYSSLKPQVNSPTISFEYKNNIAVEYVTAYKNLASVGPSGETVPEGEGYWVSKEGEWKFADYDHDAKTLSTYNDHCDKRLVPIIKMIKAAKNHQQAVIKSYFLEILAIRVLPSIIAKRKQKMMSCDFRYLIPDFFHEAQELLHQKQSIPDSRTEHNWLTPEEAIATIELFKNIVTHCKSLNTGDKSNAHQITEWRILFGDHFPSS